LLEHEINSLPFLSEQDFDSPSSVSKLELVSGLAEQEMNWLNQPQPFSSSITSILSYGLSHSIYHRCLFELALEAALFLDSYPITSAGSLPCIILQHPLFAANLHLDIWFAIVQRMSPQELCRDNEDILAHMSLTLAGKRHEPEIVTIETYIKRF
jgi:hypothetical protein